MRLLFKKGHLLLLLLLCLSIIGKSQSWATLWSEDFNGFAYESCYPSGGDSYWANCGALAPRNSLINGFLEATTNTLGWTQSPGNGAGGRFLMYLSQFSSNTSGGNVFFRKTISNAVVGQPYRVSFKIGALGATSPPNLSLVIRMNGTTTTIYSETSGSFPSTAWTTVSYAGTGNAGNAAMQFTATATSFTLEWVNSNTAALGNDFALDDVLIETTTYSVAGRLFNDNNGTTGGVNGSPYTSGATVNLYAADGTTIITSTATNASGVYTFSNVLPGDYEVGITAPSGYRHVSSTDATPADGKTSFSITTANISGLNFGINQPPTANAVSNAVATPTSKSIPQGTITTAVSGNDPGVGALGNGNTVVVTTLPTNGILYYSGAAVVQGSAIGAFNPSLLSFTNLQSGTLSTGFNYTFVDIAGLQGSSAVYSISWPTILPITFGSFSATKTDNTVLLEWTTLMENNNNRFEIEYSNNASDGWVTIGLVPSKALQGNSSTKLYYDFRHLQPQAGNGYYRIKQIDFDGKYSYSSARAIRLKMEVEFSVFPNPAYNMVTISAKNTSMIRAIIITSMTGTQVRKYDRFQPNIDLSNLARGIYNIQVLYSDGTAKTKMIEKK